MLKSSLFFSFREGILQVTLFLVELPPSVLCPAVLQFSYVASNEKEIGLVCHRVLHSPVTSELADSPLFGGAYAVMLLPESLSAFL